MASVHLFLAATLLGIVLGWHRRERRLMLIAVGFGALMTWLGHQGSLGYLGIVSPAPEAWYGPLTVYLSIVLLNLLVGEDAKKPSGAKATNDEGLGAVKLDVRAIRIGLALVTAGCLLFAYRFSVYGVPILTQSRFTTVSALSPAISLLTSTAIVVGVGLLAHVPGKMPPRSRILVALCAILIVASGSRLLLLALLVCIAAGRVSTGSWRLNTRSALASVAITGLILGVVLPAIYTLRATNEDGTSVLSERVRRDSTLSPLLVRVIGPSTYISARNSSIVATKLLATGQSPEGGYVGSAAQYVVSIVPGTRSVEDPEIYLTEFVFGLDRDIVGSVALPVATAVQVDFGLKGCAIFGALSFFLYIGLVRRERYMTSAWFAFGFGISAYGMYIISLQFVSIFAGFLILEVRLAAARRTLVAR